MNRTEGARLRRLVYRAYVEAAKPLTYREVAQITGLSVSAVGRHVAKLCDLGLLVRSDRVIRGIEVTPRA